MKKERKRLLEAYRRFRGGSPENLLLTGESGVGKTYLLEQFLSQIAKDDCLVFKAVCLENEQRIRFQPWNVLMLQMMKTVKDRKIQAEDYTKIVEYLFPAFSSEEGEDAFMADCTIPYSYIGSVIYF